MERKLGHFLKDRRAGLDGLTSTQAGIASAPKSIRLQSNALDPEGRFMREYTADGAALDPPFSWTGIPLDAKEFSLIIEDLDVPTTTPFVHFIAYGIVGENLENAKIGKNSRGKAAYLGPRPLLGHGVHRYSMQIFALDQKLYFKKTPGKREILRAMQNHVLARGELIGTYERK